MATLLSLPSEIVLNIIEELLPDDILSFSSSCKRMQALSRKSLSSYHEYKKKYPEVKFYGCPEKDNRSDLPAVLQHTFADQRIATYPPSMILESPICSMDCAHWFEYNPGIGDNDHSNEEAKKFASIEELNGLGTRFDNGTMRTKDETADQRLGAGRVWLCEYILVPLVEMLPSCVETVRLEGPLHMRGVDLLLTDLTTAKGRRLRCLKTIVVRGVRSPSALMLKSAKVWMERCAAIGIYLDFEWNKWFSDIIGRG